MSIVPSGRKLTTYDPDHPEWDNNTAQQDSDLWRNYLGFLLEKPGIKANKRLVVITGGDDPQEQSAHKTLRFVVKELLSGSNLARRLIHRFSFLIVPLGPMQGVRDGFSRFSFDCVPPGEPGNTVANGGTEIGDAVTLQAVANWMSDHPQPSAGGFCVGQFHCDNLNHNITDKGAYLQEARRATDFLRPTSPYGAVIFPGHEADPDLGLASFKGDANSGFASRSFPEFYQPNVLIAGNGLGANPLADYGGTQWYFELPWRHTGHKASFWSGDDAQENLALSFLEGLAVAAGTAIPLEDPAIQAGAQVALTFKKTLSVACPIQAGAEVALTAEMIHVMPCAVQSGAHVALTLSRTAMLDTLAVQAGAQIAMSIRKAATLAADTCASAATVADAEVSRTTVQIGAVACTSAATLSAAVGEQCRRQSAVACTSAATTSTVEASRTGVYAGASVCTSAATTSLATYTTAKSVGASACTSAATLSAALCEVASDPNIRSRSAIACTSAATSTATSHAKGARRSAQNITSIALAIATTGDSNSAYYNRFILRRRY